MPRKGNPRSSPSTFGGTVIALPGHSDEQIPHLVHLTPSNSRRPVTKWSALS